MAVYVIIYIHDKLYRFEIHNFKLIICKQNNFNLYKIIYFAVHIRSVHWTYIFTWDFKKVRKKKVQKPHCCDPGNFEPDPGPGF